MFLKQKSAARGWCFGLLVLSLAVFSTPLLAQRIADKPPQPLRGVGIDEHLGQTLPMNLVFTNARGEPVKLSDYFHKGKPVLLSLGYYSCPMLCPFVWNGVANAVQKLNWMPGEKFQLLTVSFDPRDTPELAAQKQTRYLQSLNKPGVPDSAWDFLVGDASQSKALANALGFKFHYDPKQKMYAHTAAVFILTETGKISRYLYGIEYNVKDLKLGLLEASQGKIGNSIDQLLLFCYHYDPNAQGYVLFATNVMKIGGIITLIILGFFLSVFWARERIRHRS